MTKDTILMFLRRNGALVVLAIILTAVSTAAPGILRWRAINSLLQDNAPLLIMIVGATLPILLGCLDLSIAAMASLAAVMAAMLSPALGSASAYVVVAGAAMIGGLQGWMIGRLQVPSFVISLGALGIFKGIGMYLTAADMVGIAPGISVYETLGSRSFGISNAFILVLIVAWLFTLMLKLSNLGRNIYAFGANEIAVYISGVRRDMVRAFAFAASSGCAALGGVMMISQTMFASATVANSLLLPALVGVVVGGTAISGGVGGVLSSLIGGLIAILIRVGVTISGLPPESQDVAFGITILIAVALTTDRAKIGLVK
ncbi:ABC transporter permease [Cypionkella sp.]|uniref:ABC transporter permease n=1 Tax=Cypionkella sp. TaxID=2811411 RepID=UPI00272202F8|nr:ABC transporter permease [Cypionkella sp.]MDO8986189.1 ABC transporter permease [Cypionkella sp.]MDP1577965.1 ABC transporter permease [Cypionkella sp.]MDP2050373.1 ABC transporter permease [Cypionkella sp.]